MENNNKVNLKIKNNKIKNVMNYIYEDQFINLVNSVSSSIKEYFKNNKLYMNNLKLCIDGINEQTLFSKSAVNDILVYLNQITKSKSNVTNKNMNEKYIKEKLYSINDRINKINQYKNNLIENIKNSEMTFINFYEEQQNLFNKMRIIQNKNLNNFHSEILFNNYIKNQSRKNYNTVSHSPKNKNLNINNTLNSRNKIFSSSLDNNTNNCQKEDDYSKLKLQYNELFKEYENLKNLLLKRKNPNNNLKKLIPSNSNAKGLKLKIRSKSLQNENSLNKEIENNTNSRNIKLIKNNSSESNSLDFNRYSSSNDNFDKKLNNLNIIKSNENNIETKNKNNLLNQEIPNSNSHDSSNSNINLATMVLNFLKNMKLLQESISKKLDNVQELKKNFEIKKKDLIKISENILENSNININLITVNNSQNFSNKNLSPIIQQTPEKDTYKEKESLGGSFNNLNSDINKLKKELKIKDENIKKEKNLNLMKENQLNNEKSQNKDLKEHIYSLQTQIKDLSSLSDSQNKTIKNLQTINNELSNGKNELNDKINSLLNENSNFKNKNNSLINENKEYQNKLDTLNKEYLNSLQIIESLKKENSINLNQINSNIISDNKNINELNEIKEKNIKLENEISSLKIDNQKLQKTINEHNTNIISLRTKNEGMINEKDKIIDNLRLSIKDLNSQIESFNNNTKNLSNEEISTLQKNNEDYKEQITLLNKENRDLKNKMAEIKNEYVSHDEDLENLKKGLIEINENTFSKIKQFKEKNLKLESIRNEFSNKIKEEKKKNEIKNDNEIYYELENNSNEYSNYINIIKKYTKNITEINSDLQNKIIKKIDNQLNKELDILKNENQKLKEQLGKIKDSTNNKKEGKEGFKTISDKNEQHLNFIDEDLSELRNDLKNEMENNYLLKEQLNLIKKEVKEYQNQNNELQNKVNLLSKKASLVDDNVLDKIEVLQILKQTFEKLIESIQFVGQVKELIIMILKLLNYSENDIQKIIDKKEKRNLFGIFK